MNQIVMKRETGVYTSGEKGWVVHSSEPEEGEKGRAEGFFSFSIEKDAVTERLGYREEGAVRVVVLHSVDTPGGNPGSLLRAFMLSFSIPPGTVG